MMRGVVITCWLYVKHNNETKTKKYIVLYFYTHTHTHTHTHTVKCVNSFQHGGNGEWRMANSGDRAVKSREYILPPVKHIRCIS